MTMHMKPDDILRRASSIGSYYGFTALSTLAATHKMSKRVPYPDSIVPEALDPVAREVASFLKHVRDIGLVPSTAQPLFIWHTNAAPGRPAPKNLVIQFHALGVEHSIADAVLMRAVRAFLQDVVKGDHALRINSMGDKETRSRFARELTTFFRKHGATLPENCVNCAKRDVFEAAELLAIADADVLPSSTDHLSEASRKHFESVLEYLESTDTPYELASDLLSRGASWTETCFEITAGDRAHAWGSRYSEFAKAFWKSHVPSIGAVIRITTDDRETMAPVKTAAAPRFVFVHIGDEAKRESMMMADDLRRARISLSQNIGIQSLSEQMRYVDALNPPYVLIMGRKEALERSVILRNRATYTEVSIPLDSLVERLREVA
ncbi:MAG: histidyl-tRNA synthetase [Candidatus Parcubacteria bacterium]|jgi:histidyl-tRNA synthetase|nr:histidyl-tRNA synthetase [Candidatus Parcubacteria bacterium]